RSIFWASRQRRAGAMPSSVRAACCLLLALTCMLACQAQPTPRLPLAPQRTETQDPPEPAAPEAVSVAALPEQDTIVYEFVDPERRNKLLASLSDLDTWTEERGRALNVAGLLVGVVID